MMIAIKCTIISCYTRIIITEKSRDNKWVITVMNDDGLGTIQRIQEKLIKICTLSRNAEVIEGNARKELSSQISQALIERERAQKQAKKLEKQLVIEVEKKKAAETKVKQIEEAMKQQEEDIAEELSQANERAQVAEKRSHELEQRSHDAEQ